MSGTMLKNGLKDSYFPVMFLSWNSPWKNWTDFKNKELLFKNPMVPNMITGIRDERYLADLMKPLIITMENPDSPKELVAHIIKCDMGMDQRAAYETMKEELILEAKNGTLTISNHAVLNLRCRQFVAMPEALGHDASSAKEEALAELLPTLTGKTIIFTSFATAARILSERYKWPIIEGATSARNRKEILESAPDILVCTSAGERGVDCPWVTNIISLDAGFTSAVIRQRAGRATRYGRTGEAKLFLIQCKDSVDIYSEERIILRKLKEARKVCMAQSHSR
jgi:superfamily II DNA or RNA helicase